MAKNDRQTCYDMLVRLYRQGGYSNLTLNDSLNHSDGLQAGFVTALFYGVAERSLTLDYLIEQYAKRPLKKLDIEIVVILKMGLYQLLYLDSVPDRAAVNESVSLCIYARKASAKGFVNGVLRSFLRDGKKIALPQGDAVRKTSIACSCPEWLIRLWAEAYSAEAAQQLAESALGRPPLTAAVNTLKTSAEELISSLNEQGIKAVRSLYLDTCLHLEQTGSLESIPAFQDGLFYVQDLASQICVRLLDPQAGMTVLDLCSAPGSKAFTAAVRMKNQGQVFAYDLHAHKVALIKEGAGRLGIRNLTAGQADATEYNGKMPKAERVLCDVPCSGFGIIRRKPEIKYKSKQSVAGLPEIQRSILKNASRYVKSGGKLVYATCTLNPAENEQVVTAFLTENPDFRIAPVPEWLAGRVFDRGGMMTFLPQYMDSDGFFTAVLEYRG